MHSSARARAARPITPGRSPGKIDLTEQGMISMHSSVQGPGRQIMDRSYYIGKLRAKKQDLQAEVDKMVEKIESLDKKNLSTVQLEQKQQRLLSEIKNLKLELGDYSLVMDKVNAELELEDMKHEFRLLKDRNMKERKRLEKLFLERTLKEREANEILDKAQLLELDMERKIATEAPEAKLQYAELQQEFQTLEAEVESLQCVISEVTISNQSLEQKVTKSSPVKQKAVLLTEQLLSVEGELERVKLECPSSHLSMEEAKEALLSKIQQDNLEVKKAEEKSKELETEIRSHETKLWEAEIFLSELKGGRMEKFIEMQQKEKKMQVFIDNYHNIRLDYEKRKAQTHESISRLREHINQGLAATEGYNASKANHVKKFEEIEHLKTELERHREELKKLEDLDKKTDVEITNTKQRVSVLEDEADQFNRHKSTRVDAEAKRKELEAEKEKLRDRKNFMQGQVVEQIEKIVTIRSILEESEVHKSLEEMREQLNSLLESNQKLQEEVETKDRELNYKPVLENIRFMVSQLNTEIKNSHAA